MASVSKSNQSTKQYEQFCSFCFHSKRPEEEFSSHWVKDKKDGTVTCPLLLENVCGYCKGKGHTPKHCERLASRNERRKEHAKRMAGHRHCNGGCAVRGADKVQQQIRQKEASSAQQKRERIHCNDNQYAALMGVRALKRVKTNITKAAPVWNGPKVTIPRTAQGVWGKAAKTASAVKNMTADEVSQLKVLLSQMGIIDQLVRPNEQAWMDAEMAKTEQSLTETAEGEAFFDNVESAERIVQAMAADDQPEVPPAVALPDNCNLDADFGGQSSTDWGDDALGMNVVCE